MAAKFSLSTIIFLLVGLFISLSSFASPFTFADEFLKADEAFITTIKQQGDKISVDFQIAPGYYLYRQQFNFQSSNLTLDMPILPEGIIHEDQYYGVQQIYRERLTFKLNIKKAANNAKLSIRFQGCADKGLCYPPSTKSISIQPTQ